MTCVVNVLSIIDLELSFGIVLLELGGETLSAVLNRLSIVGLDFPFEFVPLELPAGIVTCVVLGPGDVGSLPPLVAGVFL